MRRRLVLLALLPLALAACGGLRQAASTGPATTQQARTTTAAAPGTSVIAYFLRDGKVAPVRVQVPRTRAVATAALRALLEPAPDGLDTAIPSGAGLDSVAIDNGIATASLSGVGDLPLAAEAQLVYTLTQFPTVNGVALANRPILDEHGVPLTEPATRADFEGETPAILVESPLPGDALASPLRVSGTANTFEARFELELVQDGKILASEHAAASSGSGERGDFDVKLSFAGSGPATLSAYELSAADGSVVHRVDVPVTLR